MKARSLSTLALVVMSVAAASAVANAKGLDGGHSVTTTAHHFLLDGKLSFLIVGESRVCPDLPDVTDQSGSSTIAQSMASLKVKILMGSGVFCGGNTQDIYARLDPALGPLQMMWQETSKGIGPQPAGLPELLDWQPPINSVQYPVDLPCGPYTSAGLYYRVAGAASKGPVLAWVPIGSSPQDGQYVCLTPQKIRNDAMTAVVAHASGIAWMTIDPRDANVNNGFSVMRGDNGQPNNFSAAENVALKLLQLSTVLAKGKWLKVTYPSNQPIRAAAWSYQRVLTIIAVNTSGQTGANAVIAVPALGKKHAKITVRLKAMADVTIKKKLK